MKLDVFNHILPPAYFDRLKAVIPDKRMLGRYPLLPTLTDVEARFRMMDAFDDYRQVLSLANPPLEALGSPAESAELARIANDGMAELCGRYPDRFPAFTASVALNDPDGAVTEAQRAIDDLGARGVQIFTNVLGRPIGAAPFRPLFECLAGYDLPVWVHPIRGPNHPDYMSEELSEHEIWFTFGWPYETSACMARLIFSGLFDALPDLKIVTHHMGGMIPFFAEKIAIGFEQLFEGGVGNNPLAARAGLEKQPIDYYRMLYGDTALNGSRPATVCGYEFFGAGQSLFATDAPFDPEGGALFIRGTIDAVDSLDIDAEARERIYEKNARELLKLDPD